MQVETSNTGSKLTSVKKISSATTRLRLQNMLEVWAFIDLHFEYGQVESTVANTVGFRTFYNEFLSGL